jgi:molecular chaperone GrpE
MTRNPDTEVSSPAETLADGLGAQPEPASPDLPADDLAVRLQEAERRAEDSREAMLRAVAEAENARRRAKEEAAKAVKYALESFATALLPVKDSLEAALATENTTVEQIRSGVELTVKQLGQVLAKENVEEVNPVDQRFDPNYHQAIAALPSEKEPNHVINVLQKGYRLHDRVLRPALVTVSQAKES